MAAPGNTGFATKADATRQRILDAAAMVFREKGFAGARLSDIATAAGMQTGSLYYHFGSRLELVEAVLHAGVTQSLEAVRSRVEALGAGASPGERLRAAITAHLVTVVEIGGYASANIRIFFQVPDDVRRRTLTEHRELGAYFGSLLAAAQRGGEIRADVDTSIVRMLIFGALNWAPEWFDPGGRHSPEDVAAQLVTMVFDGLTPIGER